jgi:predicted acylesterase/phospholipase RssA
MATPRRLATIAAIGAVIAIALGAWQTKLAEAIEVGGAVPGTCSGMAVGTKGAVRLQFAYTDACASALVEGWRQRGIDGDVVRSTIIDFPFLLAYGVAVTALCLWLATRFEERTRPQHALRLAALATIAAAACDATENLGLLRMLGTLSIGPPPFWTFAIASLKFGLLGFALVTAPAAWIVAESRAAQARNRVPPAVAAAGPVLLAHRAIYLWPLRVQIVTGLVLIVLPSLPWFEGPARYLGGLFDPIEETALLPIALLSLLCAWTIAITGRLVLAYGGARMQLPKLPGSHRGHVPAHLWGWSAPLAVPTVVSTICYSHTASKSSVGAMVVYATMGVVAACFTLAIVLMLSRRAMQTAPLFGSAFQRVLRFVDRHPCLASGYVAGTPPQLLPGHGIGAVLAIASFLTYLLVRSWTQQVDRPLFVSTLAFVLLFTLMLSWFAGLMAFLFDRTRAPLFVFLFAYILIINFGIERFVTTDLEYETYQRSTPPPARSTTLTAGTTRPIVVAASGGGIQAAAWTTRVLTGLADDRADFQSRVRLISGVSGGSVGAMHYLTQQASCSPVGSENRVTSRPDALKHAMESSLHAAGWGLVFQDLPRTVVPFLMSPLVNRGSLLEDAWKRDRRLAEDASKDGSPALMSNWGAHVPSGACPGVVFNAMVAETGEPMLFSTALLPASLERFAFERHYPDLDLKLATAARLSAAFPYVSPAAHAQHDTKPSATGAAANPRQGHRHIVDGGYFDNFGVATAVEWLNAELIQLEKDGQPLPTRVMLVEICEEPSCSSSVPAGALTPGGPRRSLPYQLYAPLSALYQMRGAAQRARNRWHVRLLQQRWGPRVTIESALFPYPSEAGPMSWHLSEAEKANILRSWDDEAITGPRLAVANFVDATDKAAATPSDQPSGSTRTSTTPASAAPVRASNTTSAKASGRVKAWATKPMTGGPARNPR